MKKLIIGLLVISMYSYSNCDIALRNGINSQSCTEASGCLKKNSSILEKDLSKLQNISERLYTNLNKTAEEYAMCANYRDLSIRKPNIKAWAELAKDCTSFYSKISRKLANINEYFKILSKKRKADLEDTLIATQASLEYVKKKCQ